MKIAFLNIYNGLVDRGAETFVKELASRLSKKHLVTVFQAGKPKGSEVYEVTQIPIDFDLSRTRNVFTVQGRLFLDYRSRRKALFTLRSIPELLDKKFDIIIPLNGGWQPALIRLATWLYGGKMVISGQSGMGWDDRNNLWCFPNAFVALSGRARIWAKKANPLIKTEYIPNGVDLEKFISQGEVLAIKLQRPTILCAGALTKSKRIDLAIKAVSRLKNVSLLIAAGGGELKKEIEELGRKLLPGRFQLIKVPYESMPKVYRSADIFTIPSESYYAFEIVLAEAMASGLPVVANDDPIRQEIVGDAGILVDPTDVEGYSLSLRKAIESNWGDKPRKQAEKFDWRAISARYEALFQSLFR